MNRIRFELNEDDHEIYRKSGRRQMRASDYENF